jgi:uncharacterized delta-60 repeat protein
MRSVHWIDVAIGATRVLLLVMLSVLLLLTGEGTCFAANGDLDTTFLDPQVNNTVHALALQPDGKVLIGGEFSTVGPIPTTMNHVARLTSTGGFDSSFLFNPGVGYWDVYALALQSDGNVLIGGDFTTVNGATRNYVARLTSTGALDTTFGDANVGATVWALALQTDGKVLIGGEFTTVGPIPTTMNHVARLLNAKPTAVTLSQFRASANDTPLPLVFAGGIAALMLAAAFVVLRAHKPN